MALQSTESALTRLYVIQFVMQVVMGPQLALESAQYALKRLLLCCRWYRDPNQPIPRTDITRFPHAVLEVKLSLPEGQVAPEWVTDLTESGFLTEVSPDQAMHNFHRLMPVTFGCGQS